MILPVVNKTLEITTSAVRLKEKILKRQLRRAVTKAVHTKQYQKVEDELVGAIAGLIKSQYRDAAERLKQVGGEKKGTDQSNNLANQIFNPREWDDALVDTALPVLMKHAGYAAAAQMLLVGVDVTRGKKIAGCQQKSTTATEWLAENTTGAGGLDQETFILPDGTEIDMAFVTEWPPWMKQELVNQVTDTFEQPFWLGINDTTLEGLDTYLKEGLKNGWSIDKIAKEMVGAGLDEYYRNRGRNIARTETGNALNGARSAAMDRLVEEVPGLVTRKEWLSVLGSTTRASHADLDGVPADKDGMWNLGGIRIPWPAHYSLPPKNRCNCQCTIVYAWGLRDEEAEGLIEDYNRRLAAQKMYREKYNPNHGPDGRFTTYGAGGAVMAPDTGGGGSGGFVTSAVSFDNDEDATDWLETNMNVSLTEDELRAKSDYSASGFWSINGYARGTEEIHQLDLERVKKTTESLSSAIDKSSIPHDVVSYRGVRQSLLDDLFGQKGPQAGDVLEDNGFASTSLMPMPRGRSVFRLVLPRGTKALYGSKPEMELILARGSRFVVKGVSTGPLPGERGDFTIIDVEISQ